MFSSPKIFAKMPNFLESPAVFHSTDIVYPTIYSKRAIIYERNSKKILYGKNINYRCKMASTTKIMASIAILNNINLDSTVIISKKAASIGGSRLGLHAGDKISARDLLYGMLLCSGNDAAIALSEKTAGSTKKFVYLMNLLALNLGLKQTHFESPHGLDSKDHFTTVYELAKITDYALNIKEFRNIVSTRVYTVHINGKPKKITNTNELLGQKNIYGVKTGFTSKAGRCLVSAYKDENLDIIVIVLGADSKKTRTLDSKKLIEFVKSNYKIINIQDYSKKVIFEEFLNYKNSLKIKKSANSKIMIVLSDLHCKYYPFKKSEKYNLSYTHTFLKNELTAPVKKGTKLSYMTFYINSVPIDTISVYSDSNIIPNNPFNYFYIFFIKLKNISNNTSF